MKLAAANAIAEIIGPDELHPDYIIPSVFDRRVGEAVAPESRKPPTHRASPAAKGRHRIAVLSNPDFPRSKIHYFYIRDTYHDLLVERLDGRAQGSKNSVSKRSPIRSRMASGSFSVLPGLRSLVVLASRTGDGAGILPAVSSTGSSLVILYAASTLYHGPILPNTQNSGCRSSTIAASTC